MRYHRYGVDEFGGSTGSREPVRGRSKGLGTGREAEPGGPEAELWLPQGVTQEEAAFLLGIFMRLKEKRFGRVEVTVHAGSVTSIELVEKVDRNLFRSFSS